MIYIGIDPGKHTGLAVWNAKERRMDMVQTMPIHRALQVVYQLYMEDDDTCVVFEDARKRRWYSGDAGAKQQGAGSIKRDCTIWEDFCQDLGIPYKMVPPQKGMTKWPADYFRKLTGYDGRTSDHARDAAALVFGR